MFKRFLIASLVASVAMLAVSVQSKAAVVTDEFTVTASGFVNQGLGGQTPIAPVDPFTAVFDVTFDPSLNYAPTNTGFVLKSASFGYASDYGFIFNTPGSNNSYIESIQVGRVSDGQFVGGLYDTGYFFLDLNLSTINGSQVSYRTDDGSIFASVPSFYPFVSDITVTVSTISAVPLPAALPLFAAAFAGLTGLRMRRARGNKAA